MKVYFIRTEATEDTPAMTCSYGYMQWIDLIDYFKKTGRKFKAWSEVM